MTTPARGGESNVVYPDFGGGADGDTKAFQWSEHVDWSEIAPDEAAPAPAMGPNESKIGDATVIEFPSASEEF